jgi:hypothetical protein
MIERSNRLTVLAAQIDQAHRDVATAAERAAERALGAGAMLLEAAAELDRFAERHSDVPGLDAVGPEIRLARRMLRQPSSQLIVAHLRPQAPPPVAIKAPA